MSKPSTVRSRTVSASRGGRGDDDQQVRDVRDAVHEVRRDARQVLVREVARREDVHRVHRLWTNGILLLTILCLTGNQIKCICRTEENMKKLIACHSI